MHYNYKTKNTCSTHVSFDLNDGIVTNIRFIGGCEGNLTAISKLGEGMQSERLKEILKGITCGRRPTSCGDQLARAVAAAEESQTKEA